MMKNNELNSNYPMLLDCPWLWDVKVMHNWRNTFINIEGNDIVHIIATLALVSQPKRGLAKVQAKSETQESHFMMSRVWENVKEWTPTLPSELPLWELESKWTSKSS